MLNRDNLSKLIYKHVGRELLRPLWKVLPHDRLPIQPANLGTIGDDNDYVYRIDGLLYL